MAPMLHHAFSEQLARSVAAGVGVGVLVVGGVMGLLAALPIGAALLAVALLLGGGRRELPEVSIPADEQPTLVDVEIARERAAACRAAWVPESR